MTEFHFVDALPPRKRDGDPVLREFVDALRAQPGRWAKYPLERTPATAAAIGSNIRSGDRRAPKAFHDGSFEAQISQKVLYVRFVGGAS